MAVAVLKKWHSIRRLTTASLQGSSGLEDCKHYMSQKQYYTMQDVLVVQYILNGGVLMRQQHGSPDEHDIDITQPVGG